MANPPYTSPAPHPEVQPQAAPPTVQPQAAPPKVQTSEALTEWLARYGQTPAYRGAAAKQMTVPQFLEQLSALGIDTTDPAVQNLAHTVDIDALVRTPGSFGALLQVLKVSYPSLQQASYQQALSAYGFPVPDPGKVISPDWRMGGDTLLSGTIAAPPVVGPTAPPVTETAYSKALDIYGTPTAAGGDYVTQPKTGALMYKNGVIADPNSKNVYYPSPATPGSPGWLIAAQRTWGDKQIAEWRQRLTELHYLPKDAGKGKAKGWDEMLRQAISNYYQAKYLNGGIVQPLPPGGGQADQIENLHAARATIAQDVRQQFQSVFGQDPSSDELASWTRWAISLGNKLQRQTSISGAGAASAEPVARATERMQQSGAGQFQERRLQENTSLHDSIIAAVQATQAVLE